MAKSYSFNRDTVLRALRHHEQTGAVNYLKAPGHDGNPNPKHWTVRVFGMSDYYKLTLGEAHAMCVGLAAAERFYGRQVSKLETSNG